MAVKAGSIRNDFPEPLGIYNRSEAAENDDCSIVQPSAISDIVFGNRRFRSENFHFSETNSQVDDGLAMLGFLCGATPKTTLDRPEFVDIDKLSEITAKAISPKVNVILELSDDDDDNDDVVFVTEYRNSLFDRSRAKDRGSSKDPCYVEDQCCSSLPGVSKGLTDTQKDAGKSKDLEISETQKYGAKEKIQSEVHKREAVVIVDSDDSRGSDSIVRRNPVRTTRSKRKGKKDELFEEDFAFLDSSDDEEENEAPSKRACCSPATVKEDPPIRLQEKSKNSMKKKGFLRKSKSTMGPSKKKCTTKRKRKSVPVETVPIEELKQLVNSTTDILKDYFVNSKKHKHMTNQQSEICTFENKLEVLKNQALLFSIVNNLDENEVMEKFKLLSVENETKDS